MTSPTPFRNRWLISGTLTSTSPVFVGSGDTTSRKSLTVPTESGEGAVEVQALNRGVDDVPFLPGSSIKGILRQRLQRGGCPPELIEQLMGSPAPLAHEDAAFGGNLQFHDARLVKPVAPPNSIAHFEDGIGVATGVAIDRKTGTAADAQLWNREYLPPKSMFRVEISGQNIGDAQGDPGGKNAIETVLNGLRPGIQLGAGKGNGWGHCEWKTEKVSRMDKASVKAWLQSIKTGAEVRSTTAAGLELFTTFGSEETVTFQLAPKPRWDEPSIHIQLEVEFTGGFLVNEPALTRRKNSQTKEGYNHLPRLTADGKAMLPGSSIRGVLRSHGERILKTLGGERDEVTRLGNGIFGSTRNASALQFTDTASVAPAVLLKQEFVAIDRLTGGSSESAKFNAQIAWCPHFIVQTTILPCRWKRQGMERQGVGLLALILRDWVEGDLSFGFGEAKGYGACRARFKAVSLEGAWEPHSLFDDLPASLKNAESWLPDCLTHEDRHWIEDQVDYLRKSLL